jgi:hypothetical protein
MLAYIKLIEFGKGLTMENATATIETIASIAALGDNRHMVDRLAMIRAAIKQAEEIEADLKKAISAAMGAGDTLIGDEWAAVQKIGVRKGGLDEKAMAAAGIDVEAFRKPASSTFTMTCHPIAA